MRVAMMLYAGFQMLEVSGPMDVFHEANRLCGGTLYEHHLIELKRSARGLFFGCKRRLAVSSML
jgi:transcriptional regulator GlxA family with amidase domain